MRGKRLLAAFLLAVGLCFVLGMGDAEIQKKWLESSPPYIDFRLLMARVDYMMSNPTNFLDARFFYDEDGILGKQVLEDVDTKGKIFVMVIDNRGVFSDKEWFFLLADFQKELEAIYPSIKYVATDMDADVVAAFYTKEVLVGYFYQGEYHLWGE